MTDRVERAILAAEAAYGRLSRQHGGPEAIPPEQLRNVAAVLELSPLRSAFEEFWVPYVARSEAFERGWARRRWGVRHPSLWDGSPRPGRPLWGYVMAGLGDGPEAA